MCSLLIQRAVVREISTINPDKWTELGVNIGIYPRIITKDISPRVIPNCMAGAA
jgi:hypothetical protein